MEKDIPVISLLLKAMILGDYNEAMDIVTDENFNPNDKTKTLESPVISAMMVVIYGTTPEDMKPEAKAVFNAIIKNKKFNPNEVDNQHETILMHIARNKYYNWLAPLILACDGVDVHMKNMMGRTALDIATSVNNLVVRDLLMARSIKDMASHSPKKKVGLKKVKKPQELPEINKVLNNIEVAFTPESKEDPVSLYNLTKYFVKGNYDECLKIVKHIHFDPNEMDRWDEPVLSCLIHYSQDSAVNYDEEKFKEIVIAIINNRMFDVNALDADCNTTLMVAMGYPKLKWMVKELFKISSAKIDLKNEMGEDLSAIAEKCGNSEFLSDMIRRSYETAKVVS